MFQTLVKYIGEFKRDAVLTPVLVVMEVIMEVIIPIIMAVIIDYGLESRSLGKVEIRMDIWNACCTFITSVVILVTSPAVENLSILEKEKVQKCRKM